MKKTTSFLVIVAVVALFSSCACNKSTTLDFLQKDLVVVSLQGEHICCNNENPPTMFLDTLESRASGSTGCNRYFTQYEMTDSTVLFSMPGTTMMACDSFATELEVKMLDVLNSANRYEVTADELILKNGDAVLAVLKELKKPEDRCCKKDEPAEVAGEKKCSKPCDKPCGTPVEPTK